jgi:hypothetical protein
MVALLGWNTVLAYEIPLYMHEMGTVHGKCVPHQTFVGEDHRTSYFIILWRCILWLSGVFKRRVVCSRRICSLHWKDYTIDNQNGTPFVGRSSFLFCSADILKLLWKKWAFFFRFVEISCRLYLENGFVMWNIHIVWDFKKWSFILFSPSHSDINKN